MALVSPRGFVRPVGLLIAVGAAMSLAHTASAQYAWVPSVATGSVWSNAANWSPGAPTSGIDTSLSFWDPYYSGSFTSTDDIAGNFDVNRISLMAECVNSTPTSSVLNIAGSAGSTLTFNTSSGGSGPSISIDGAGNSALASSLSVLLASNLSINATNVGTLFVSCNLANAGAGNRDVTINCGNALVSWAPSSVASWVGNLNLNGGTFALTSAGALGSAATNALVVNGGTMRLATATTAIANNITLNSDLQVESLGGFQGALLTGSLSGPGGLRLVSQGGGSAPMNFEGASGFGGSVTSNSGNAPHQGNITLRNTNGAFTGATSYSLTGGATLTLDNSTSGFNGNRVRDDASVTLNRSVLTVTANATAANVVNETIGSLAFSGMSSVNVNTNTTAGAGAATTLTVGSLSRQDRGTLSIAGTAIGSGAAATGVSNLVVTSAPSGDLVGGGGAAGTTNQSVLPYAIGRNLVTANALDAHVVVGANGLRPLTLGEYNQNLYLLHGTTSQENVAVRDDLVSATAGLGGALLDRDTTVNAVLVNSVSAAGNNPASLYGPGKLTVASGSLITGTSAGGVASRGPVSISVGTLDFGSAEGIVHTAAQGTLSSGTAINSVITGSNGLTKSGLGNLSLNGANTFSGRVSVNGGTLNISADNNLGNSSNELHLNGGENGTTPSVVVFQPSIMFGDGAAQSMTSTRAITLGAAGGGVGAASPNAELTLGGNVSGGGALVIGSSAAVGLVNLTGTNTHTGGTVVYGQLAINSDAALGTGDLSLQASSVLRPTAGTTSLSIANNVRLDGGASLYTPAGSTVTLSGGIGRNVSNTPSLTKVGSGELVITAPSIGVGSLVMGSAAPSVVGSQSQFELPGQTILSGNGTLSTFFGFALNEGAELVLDNTATNNNNRLASSASFNFSGGALTLKGNATAATAETMGAPAFNASNGEHVLTVRPNPAQNASLTMPSYSFASGNSWVLVRGDSLGAVPGAGVANVFIGSTPTGALASGTAPVLTNNLMPGFVASSSSTTDATTFATYNTTQGVQPLAAYSSGAILGNFTATNNVDLATPQTLSAATSANALRIRGSGTLNTAGNTLTLGTGMLLSTATSPSAFTGGGTLSLTGTGMVYNTADLNMGTTAIAGGTNMTKGGQGTLTLSSANAGLTGTINVAGGSLKFSAAGSLPSTASVFVQPSIMGDAKLDLGGFNVSLARVSGLGTVDLGTGGSLSVTSGFSSFVNILGGSAGNLALRLGSGGTLAGNSTYVGKTVLGGGTTSVLSNTPAGGSSGPFGSGTEAIQIGDTATTATTTLSLGNAVDVFNRDIVLPSATAGGAPAPQITAIQAAGTGTVSIGSNISTGRSLRLAGSAASYTSGQATISGIISNNGADAGSVEFQTGNWNLTGNNTYSGGTTLTNATGAMLGLGHNNALGTGNISVSAAAGTLRATGGARTIPNSIVFTAATTNGLGIAGVNDITFSGTVALGSTGQMVNITNAANTTFSNVISGGPATGDGFIKAGGGTLRLTAANTYSGTTRIADGALLANNTSGSVFGVGNATVEPGALLGGVGFVSGSISVSSGGIIAPGQDVGASIGTLTLGGLSTVAGSIFTFDLQDQNNPATNDLLVLTGGLSSISGIVDICPKPGFVAGIFSLMTYSGPQLTSGSLTLTPGFLAQYPTAFIDYTSQPNTVLLNVPSPGAASLLAISGLLASRRRRERASR